MVSALGVGNCVKRKCHAEMPTKQTTHQNWQIKLLAPIKLQIVGDFGTTIAI